MTTTLRQRLLAALDANSYRARWVNDRNGMVPMRWDADDAVDRIIEHAGLGGPAAPPEPPDGPDPLRDLWNAIHALRWCKSNDLLHALAHGDTDEDGYRAALRAALSQSENPDA